MSELFLTVGPEAEARRATAMPLIARDGDRIRDALSRGPDMEVGEAERQRMLGEGDS